MKPAWHLLRPMQRRRACGRDSAAPDPQFTDTLSLNLGDVVPSLAGPKRPQDRVSLPDVAASFAATLQDSTARTTPKSVPVAGTDYQLTDGDVVIAAITSCTNTSNPSVLVAAGLLAKAAHEKGLTVQPWVKTSLAPGSQVVSAYLDAAGLSPHLDALGFNTVGYGCTTCIAIPARLIRPLQAPLMMPICWSALCYPATGILKAGSAPMRRRIIWHRPRWLLPMRWPDRSPR